MGGEAGGLTGRCRYEVRWRGRQIVISRAATCAVVSANSQDRGENYTPGSTVYSPCFYAHARLCIHMCVFTYTTATAEACLLFDVNRCVSVCVCVLQYFSNLSSGSDNNLTKYSRNRQRSVSGKQTRCPSSSVSKVITIS